MTPPDSTINEAQTREAIDQKLIAAGWLIQGKKHPDLYEPLSVSVREGDTDSGLADFMYGLI